MVFRDGISVDGIMNNTSRAPGYRGTDWTSSDVAAHLGQDSIGLDGCAFLAAAPGGRAQALTKMHLSLEIINLSSINTC